MQFDLFDWQDLKNHPNLEAFKRFHTNNPKVYRHLKNYALRAKSRGKKRYSISTLWEVLRWETEIVTKTDDEFKVNNNHKPFYARLIMKQEPELKNFFETRRAIADRDPILKTKSGKDVNR